MAYNDTKILQVLKDELSKAKFIVEDRCVEDRCDGYKDKLDDLLEKVLKLERGHTTIRTNIVQKIADEVNKAGMFLYKHQPKDNVDGDS